MEPRRLLVAPQVRPPALPNARYGTPDGHFYMEVDPQSLQFTFDQPVDVQPGALTVRNLTTQTDVSGITETGSGSTRTFSFDSVLPAGNYEAVLLADRVTANGDPLDGNGNGTGGDDYVTRFFFLPGDLDHNRRVDGDDFWWIDSSFSNPTLGYHLGDLNYDGRKNGDDYFVIDSAVGASLLAPPTEPDTLTATVSPIRGRIDLSWSAPAGSPPDEYHIERSTDGGKTFASHATVPANQTSWPDVSLWDGTKYTYRIRAYTTARGESVATVRAPAVTALPAPDQFTSTSVGGTSVTLTWRDNSNNESGYELQMQVGGAGPFVTVANANDVRGGAQDDEGGTASHTVTGLSPNTTYAFQLRAVTDFSSSDWTASPVVVATASLPSMSLTAAAASTDQISLSWSAVANASTYRVEFSSDGVYFHDSAAVDSSVLGTAAEDLSANQRMFFRVVAVDSGTDIAASNIADATTFDDGLADGEPSAFATAPAPAPALAPATNATRLLVAFNGMYPLGGETLDVFGNRWFEKLAREAGGTIKPNPGNQTTYKYNQRNAAAVDLLDRIDTNHDLRITAAEVSAVKLAVIGYSWGGVEAVNFSRMLRGKVIHKGGPDYHLDVAIPVELLITIDSPRENITRIKPTWGPVETNVKKFVNWYQRRGGETTFGLWLGGSTGNGTNFSPFTKVDNETRLQNIPFDGPLRGTTFKSKLPPSQTRQINVTGYGQRHATNVEYFKDPLAPATSANYFDANLVAVSAQHDIMPWYVRGGVGSSFGADMNALQEIANV